jgi:hypothetical protein
MESRGFPASRVWNEFIIVPCLSLFLAVPEFELRVYTLSHSTSPFFVMGFFGDRYYRLSLLHPSRSKSPRQCFELVRSSGSIAVEFAG